MKRLNIRLLLWFVFSLGLANVTTQSAVAQPEGVGAWSDVISSPLRGIHAALLPTGKVLLFSTTPEQPTPFLFDPSNNSFQAIEGPGYEIFCSSHNLLADGTLLIIGGREKLTNNTGVRNITLYNPFTNTFTRQPDMNLGRWYPSSILTGDNRVFILAGTYLNAPSQQVLQNPFPQIYTKGVLKTLKNARGVMPLYPQLALMADGRIFVAGPSQISKYISLKSGGSQKPGPVRTFTIRDTGTMCQYDEGKLLYLGGGDPPTDTAEVIDLNQPDPQWRQLSSHMIAPRRQVNCTILPDGKVLITGGVSGAGFNNTSTPVLTPEIWDPATEEFSPLADMAVGRWYHSTALLLPDGRVLSLGGDGNLSAEIFSPPSLFQGQRPYMSQCPNTLYYGKSYNALYTSAAPIVAVNLIKLASVTHGVNFDQRIVKLAFVVSKKRVQFTLPTNPNLCPPGFYMIFAVDKLGRHSIGKFVKVHL